MKKIFFMLMGSLLSLSAYGSDDFDSPGSSGKSQGHSSKQFQERLAYISETLVLSPRSPSIGSQKKPGASRSFSSLPEPSPSRLPSLSSEVIPTSLPIDIAAERTGVPTYKELVDLDQPWGINLDKRDERAKSLLQEETLKKSMSPTLDLPENQDISGDIASIQRLKARLIPIMGTFTPVYRTQKNKKIELDNLLNKDKTEKRRSSWKEKKKQIKVDLQTIDAELKSMYSDDQEDPLYIMALINQLEDKVFNILRHYGLKKDQLIHLPPKASTSQPTGLTSFPIDIEAQLPDNLKWEKLVDLTKPLTLPWGFEISDVVKREEKLRPLGLVDKEIVTAAILNIRVFKARLIPIMNHLGILYRTKQALESILEKKEKKEGTSWREIKATVETNLEHTNTTIAQITEVNMNQFGSGVSNPFILQTESTDLEGRVLGVLGHYGLTTAHLAKLPAKGTTAQEKAELSSLTDEGEEHSGEQKIESTAQTSEPDNVEMAHSSGFKEILEKQLPQGIKQSPINQDKKKARTGHKRGRSQSSPPLVSKSTAAPLTNIEENEEKNIETEIEITTLSHPSIPSSPSSSSPQLSRVRSDSARTAAGVSPRIPRVYEAQATEIMRQYSKKTKKKVSYDGAMQELTKKMPGIDENMAQTILSQLGYKKDQTIETLSNSDDSEVEETEVEDKE